MDRNELPSTRLETPLPLPSSSSSSSSNINLKVSNYIFGPVPSQAEVNFAISVLESFVQAMSPNQQKPQWVVQMLNTPTSKVLISYGLKRLYDSFQMWQVDPVVKRLVISIATDKAFWDAVMNNNLVQELGKKPHSLGESSEAEFRNGNGNFGCKDSDLVATILKRIWEVTKEKVVEVVESFQNLMNKIFGIGETHNRRPVVEGCDEQLKEKVESSFLLAVIITLIVIVVRAGAAI